MAATTRPSSTRSPSTTGPDARVSYAAAYYDAADRLTASVDVGTDGGSAYTRPGSVPSRSDTVLVTSDTYNDAGWVATQTDPRGIVTQTAYDALGRPTQVIDAYDASIDGGLPTASANQTTLYTYDGVGHTLTVTADMPSGTTDQTTTYTYGVTTSGSEIDDNDLLASLTQPDSSATTYTDDSLGEVLTATDPNGTTHTYSYDVLGRVIGDAVTTLGSGVDGAVRRIATAYDAQGNAYLSTSYNAASGGSVVNQVEDVFNGLGQLIGQYQAVGGAVNTSTTPEVQYAYTEMAGGANNSRLTSMTYPDGRVVDYVYNSGLDSAISRLSAIADDSSGSPGTVLESYLYLGLDTIVEWDHPQTGVDLSYIQQPGDTSANTDGGDQYTGLDRFGRVIDQNWVDPSTGTSTVRYQYGYDPDGNVLYRADLVETALSELYHANSSASGDDATAYDALGRLTGFARGTLSASGNNGTTPDTISSPSATQSWSYDALGNQVGVTTGGTTVTQGFDTLDQETSTSSGTAPTFDADGNTLTDGSGLAYVYDAWNRLVAVNNASTSASVATYAYDGLGRRIEESYAGGSTNYLYYNSAWQVIEERQGGTSSSDVHYQYTYGATGNLILRDTLSGGSIVPADRLYAQWDANGDITAITDASGTVVERYEYSPYGQVTVLSASGSPVSGNTSAYGWQYLFQGGRQDAATGLYIFEHRDYDPASGTWMERDPLGLAGGDLNETRFAGSNPVDRTDPSGELFGLGIPSWSDYTYYLSNPGAMDGDLQTGQQYAVATAVVAGTLASGGALATYTGGAAVGNFVIASGASTSVIRGGMTAAQGGSFADGAILGAQDGVNAANNLLLAQGVIRAGVNAVASRIPRPNRVPKPSTGPAKPATCPSDVASCFVAGTLVLMEMGEDDTANVGSEGLALTEILSGVEEATDEIGGDTWERRALGIACFVVGAGIGVLYYLRARRGRERRQDAIDKLLELGLIRLRADSEDDEGSAIPFGSLSRRPRRHDSLVV